MSPGALASLSASPTYLQTDSFITFFLFIHKMNSVAALLLPDSQASNRNRCKI